MFLIFYYHYQEHTFDPLEDCLKIRGFLDVNGPLPRLVSTRQDGSGIAAYVPLNSAAQVISSQCIYIAMVAKRLFLVTLAAK